MNIQLHIPEAWNDLKPNQLKKVVWYFNSVVPSKKQDFLIFMALIDLRWYQLKKFIQILYVLMRVPISELKKYFPFISEKTDLTKFIPQIAGMDGPANRIGNITIDEFAYAEDFYFAYHKTQDFTYLQYLCAILYRKAKKHGDRTPFITSQLLTRAKYFDNVDAKTLLCVLRSYQGSRAYLISQFPKVFPKRKVSAKESKQKSTQNGLGDLILDLSSGKFGDYERTRNVGVYIFLKEFQDVLIKQQKERANLKKKR